MNAIVPAYPVSDMERMARAIAASKLFGVQNPEQALALCLVAQAEGRHPASAAGDYHIINGRPSKKADAMLRDFLSGGGKVEWHALTDEKADATFSHPAGGSARIDWTMARATQAGIANPMWKKYPRQMLRSRVVSEGVRTVYPMATSGMYVPEEVQDFTPQPATRIEQPQGQADFPAETMRDVTPALAAPDSQIRRLNSAQAKRVGLDKKLADQIWACQTRTALAEWDQEFDKHTAECPIGWLDAIRNDVILRGEAIDAEALNAGMDDAFKATVGPAEREAAHA